MAEYILDVVSQTSKLDWAFPFQRTGAFPLDRSAVFSSLADARNYALGVAEGEEAKDERKLGGTSYVGQVISVYEAAEDDNAASVNAYIITPERGLLKLAATTTSGDFAADIAALEGELAALKTAYDAKFSTVEKDIDDLQAADTALEQSIADAIGNVYTKSEVDTKETTLNTAISNEAKRAQEAEEALDTEIDGIILSLGAKANADSVYTKEEVHTYVASEIGSAGHLKREKVDALPEGENIDVDTIYMVAKEGAEGQDVYVEYMYFEQGWEIIGDTSVDLSNYITTEDLENSIAGVNTTISGVSAAVATKAAASDLEALEDEVAAITNEDTGLLAQSKAYTDEEIEKVNAVVETKVDNSTYTTTIESINTTISGINSTIGGDNGLSTRLAAVESGKADKGTLLADYGITDAYTKSETDQKIADAVKDATGGESAASVAAELAAYKTSNDAAVSALQSADTAFEGRIAALENVGAQANVLEAINFNGQDIAIVDKKATFSYTYVLPAAMADALGGVKSSSAENQIAVDSTGIMEVNSLNVNKLVQTAGDTLVLNGGSANL